MAKRADGRYVKKVTLPDGTKKYIYGASQQEVNKKARDLLNAADVGVKLDNDTTVGEWAVEWFSTYKQGLRASTLSGYRNSYNNHIYDTLAKIPLRQVRPVHIQKVMNDVSDYSEALQVKVLGAMKQIFDTAVENGLLLKSPCGGIKIKSHPTDESIKVLSESQQEELLQSVKEPRAYLFCAIGLYCGLRREELLGLMWSDIGGDELTVRRAVTFIGNKQDENHELKSKAAHRSVPIPPPLMEILKATRHKTLYLFTGLNGSEMTHKKFVNMWGHVKRSVDFNVTPRMMRHSYATSLYLAGVDLKTAQYLLGHSDIKMTANIYTHIQQGKIDDTKIKLADFWGGKNQEKPLDSDNLVDNLKLKISV